MSIAGFFRFNVTTAAYLEYLKQRLGIYDAILAAWRGGETDGLRQDIADLERHRELVREHYYSLAHKRGPQKPRKRTEKEVRAFGKMFRRRNKAEQPEPTGVARRKS